MIKRYYAPLENYFRPGEALILYGPRRVGKTTLVTEYVGRVSARYRFDSGEDARVQEVLGKADLTLLRTYLEGYALYVLDEAQAVPQVGRALKLIVDHLPHIQVIATGSSSFDLSHQVGEPLTDRKTTLTLYPIAQLELIEQGGNPYDLTQQLEERLIFGSYPKVLTAASRQEKIRLIEELVGSYVLKDILALDGVRAPRMLLDLLRLLALQVGQEVSLNELSSTLGVDRKSIARYLMLLEKSFVIYRLGGYSSNLRSEVTRNAKYYFLDNGIRNGILSHYNSLSERGDVGRLWENFIITERLKKRSYTAQYGGSYFWRTYSGQEIDLIEVHDDILDGYECKWKAPVKDSVPPQWKKQYPTASYHIIHHDNFLSFVS